MFDKKTDMEYLETWHFLFQTEGTLCGKVRTVFDQSLQRFVDAIILYRIHTEETRLAAQVPDWPLEDCDITEDQVRHIMMARLPLFGMSLEKMHSAYQILHNKQRFQKAGPSHELDSCCVLACQVLRLKNETTDAMWQRIFAGP